MSPFFGTQTYAIDHKGRISIPLSMRRVAPGKRPSTTFFLLPGFEGCLALYTPNEWERVLERLRRIPMGGRKGRAFTRAFLLNVTQVSVDGHGRITIPPALMDRAGLGKEAVLHGLIDRIELWDPQRLNAHIEEAQGHMEELGEEVLGGD